MYFIENYFTDEIINVVDDVNIAIEISKRTPDTIVSDADNNVFYCNVELPF